MTKTARKFYGFTLIELLVVIAIVGVLAAVVLIAINPARRLAQARDSGRKNDIGQIATGLQAYFTTSSAYPTAIGDLTVSGDLRTIPNDPTGGSYSYSVTGSGSSAEIAVYAALEAPTSTGSYVWCYRSSTGSASEVSGTTCTP